MAIKGTKTVVRPERSDEEIAKLVEDNMALCWHFVHKWYWVDRDEALSIAMDGLLSAAQDWTPVRNVPFGSYASLRIKWRMTRWNRMRITAKRGGGKLAMASLDQPCGIHGNGTLADTIAETEGDNNHLSVEDQEFALSLVANIKVPREQDLLQRRYGLNGYNPHTLEEIAEAYFITRERVRQIEYYAIQKIKAVAEGRRVPRSENEIREYRKDKGVARKPYVRHPKPSREAVEQLIQQGVPINEIVRRVNSSIPVVNRMVKSYLDQNARPKCGCGRPFGHKGRCSIMRERNHAKTPHPSVD